MKTTTVSILRAQLGRFLAAVKRGETIVITDRNAPVARLVPIEKTSAVTSDEIPAWFLELARRGVVRLGRMEGCRRLIKQRPPGPARGTGAVAALLDDRRLGR